MADPNHYDLTDHFHSDTPTTRSGVSTRDPGGPVGGDKRLVKLPRLNKKGTKRKPPRGVRPQTVPNEFVYTPYP